MVGDRRDRGRWSVLFTSGKYGDGDTTGLVSQEWLMKNGTTIDVKEYSYDDRGNIVSVVAGGKTTTYVYDSLGQLVRENNRELNKTLTYSYDSNGNLLCVNTYAYTVEALGEVLSTDTYTYSTGDWKDQLVSFNGQEIEYDALGNPTTYLGATLTWESLRELASYVDSNYTISYEYDINGIRSSKTVNGVKHTYTTEGTMILFEEYGSILLAYFYDEAGMPVGFAYRDSQEASISLEPWEQFTYYLFEKNLQGDITAIYDSSGEKVASYVYDAWGNHTVTNHTNDNIGNINPFRYRGYYYDSETGLYYLNSRYYDPQTRRFINADDISYLGANGDLQAYNLYAYCSNNPVMGYDPMGTWDWRTFVDVLINVGATIVSAVVGTVATTIGGVEAGVVAATATHGAINNAANAIYYNNFAIDENVIVKEPKSSKEQSFYVTGEEGSYGYRYINRFDRLDYTKSVVKSDTYDANTWRYYSEYNAHMYVWGISYWAKGSNIPVACQAAESTFNASVLNDAWDPNIGTSALTVITGILGW